ncbi:MAG TPA: BTAD domain-containing putative transcriptional regulator [Gemmatimonadaceae bacterium]|nr:BTAD domain-containing putative transcriptional regulator [Gemmatimonadaceae bacterium]
MIELQTLGASELKGLPLNNARGILGQPRRFALLAYLALARPFGFHRRDILLALFWPESDQDRARSALRQALHHIRRATGEGVVISRGADELGLDETRFRCDARDFDRCVEAGQLERAVEIYRGDLLPGLFLSDAPGLEAWLSSERLRYRERASFAADRIASAAEGAGELEKAVRYSRRSFEINPQDESVLRKHMSLLERSGDRVAAMRVFDAFSTRLAAEWDDAPGEETTALGNAIRARRRAPSPVASEPSPRAAEPVEELRSFPEVQSPPVSPAVAPSVPEPIRRRPVSRGTLLSRAAAFLVIALLGAGVILKRSAPVASGAEGPQRVVIMPFDVRAAPAWNYLGEGMVDLLGAKLDGAGQLRSADARAVLALAQRDDDSPTPGTAKVIARDLGARWFVLGSVFADSSGVQLTAALYDAARAERVAGGSATGKPGELFRLVDELTLSLLRGIQRGPASDLTRLAIQTTSSLPALKDYLQGEASFRSGHFDRAVQYFTQSTERDTTFALADYRLAVVSDFAGASGAFMRAHIARAERHSSRLGENARMLVKAFVALQENRPAEAQEIYRGIVARQPDNVEAWYQLADLQFHGGPRDGHPSSESRRAFELVLKYDPANASALIHLARLAAADERWPDLDHLTRRVLTLYPNGDEALEMLAIRGVALRDDSALAAAIDSLRESAAVRRYVTARRAIASGRDRGRGAPLFILLANPVMPTEYRARGYLGLADIAASQGRWRLARLRLADAAKLDPHLTLQRTTSLAAASLTRPKPPFSPGTVAAMLSVMARERSNPTAGVTPEGARRREMAVIYHHGVLASRGNMPALTHELMTRLAQMGSNYADSNKTREAASMLRQYLAVENDSLLEVIRSESGADASYFSGQKHGFATDADRAYLSAELLRRLGREKEALVWYRIAADDEYGGVLYAAPAAFRSAEILERLGLTAEAIRSYDRFAEVWRNADPEMQPIVSGARTRSRQLRDRGTNSSPSRTAGER